MICLEQVNFQNRSLNVYEISVCRYVVFLIWVCSCLFSFFSFSSFYFQLVVYCCHCCGEINLPLPRLMHTTVCSKQPCQLSPPRDSSVAVSDASDRNRSVSVSSSLSLKPRLPVLRFRHPGGFLNHNTVAAWYALVGLWHGSDVTELHERQFSQRSSAVSRRSLYLIMRLRGQGQSLIGQYRAYLLQIRSQTTAKRYRQQLTGVTYRQ